jgi:hypothetical protein
MESPSQRKIKCLPLLHKYGKWEDIKISHNFIGAAPQLQTGQRRYCAKCGKKQVRNRHARGW